jgi:hypothetical protein
MIIKRDLAVEAILTENLAAGHWFNQNPNMDFDPTCQVCAVGGVLRKHCFTKKYSNENLAPVISRLCKYRFVGTEAYRNLDLNNDNYLGNLSMLFEYLADEGLEEQSKDMRTTLAGFILATWPRDFEIDA